MGLRTHIAALVLRAHTRAPSCTVSLYSALSCDWQIVGQVEDGAVEVFAGIPVVVGAKAKPIANPVLSRSVAP